MPYTATAKPEGSPIAYRLGDSVKKYTLRDLGFTETKRGNFQLIRPLDPTPQIKSGTKLKLTINESLDGLKMAIVTTDGMRTVNIFNRDDEEGKMIQEKFQFLMNALAQRDAVVPVEN